MKLKQECIKPFLLYDIVSEVVLNNPWDHLARNTWHPIEIICAPFTLKKYLKNSIKDKNETNKIQNT